jgi:hypothetical protein
MLNTYEFFYYGLIGLGIIQSFVALYQGHKRFFTILLVLLLTFTMEMAVKIAIDNNLSFIWTYHVFTCLEYSLFALYLIQTPPLQPYRKYILFSLPVIVSLFLSISYFYYHFQDFPGININIEGFLLFIMCTVLLFRLDPAIESSIFSMPDVWLAFGLLAFYGGTFFYNGVYTKLVNMDEENARFLFHLINRPLNITLYTTINIGLLCLITKKKYFTQ